eukprot:1015824-Prorocentrum_minimum.AAC.1
MPCAEWCTSVDSRRLSTVELMSKAFLAVDSGVAGTPVRISPFRALNPRVSPKFPQFSGFSPKFSVFGLGSKQDSQHFDARHDGVMLMSRLWGSRGVRRDEYVTPARLSGGAA